MSLTIDFKVEYDDDYYNFLSLCCYATPLYDLHIDEGIEPTGICSHCKDNTTFEIEEEEK